MENNLKEKLETIFKLTGTNANSLSKLIQVSRGTIYNIENGTTVNPNLSLAINLEKYAGISMNWFSMNEGPPLIADRDKKFNSPELWKELKKQMEATISQQEKRIAELEFIAKLYQTEKRNDKQFANFRVLGTDKSLVYLDEEKKVVAFNPGRSIIPLLQEGDASGVKELSGS